MVGLTRVGSRMARQCWLPAWEQGLSLKLLLYHESQPEQIEVQYQNKSFGMLVAVNLNVNCRIKRDKNNNPQIHSNTELSEYGGGKLWASKRRADDEQ